MHFLQDDSYMIILPVQLNHQGIDWIEFLKELKCTREYSKVAKKQQICFSIISFYSAQSKCFSIAILATNFAFSAQSADQFYAIFNITLLKNKNKWNNGLADFDD